MLISLPTDPAAIVDLSWDDVEPYFRELEARPLDAANIDRFLADWTALAESVGEAHSRLEVATTQNTADEEAERRYRAFLDEVSPQAQQAEQQLKEKLLASGLHPVGFEEPLRKIRAEAELFRKDNVPLLTEDEKLQQEYYKIIGAQTVEWEGKEIPLQQLQPVYQNPDRALRERAWCLAAERRLADRDSIGELWQRFLRLRVQIAANADMPDYRAYRWQKLLRFDYRPEDSKRFHQAIEEVVVPALLRRAVRRRQLLGVEALRPWDMQVDPLARPPLRPFTDVAELEARCTEIFARVDRRFGQYFATMIQEGLLDLDSRANKAPGGYCTTFPAAKKPFIFANAVGVQGDVETILHEGGHAFHVFETAGLPYYQQRHPGSEFAEVASMAMELLASPYLSVSEGGFYSPADAARARIEHLESLLTTWAHVASLDALQHWMYEHPSDASDPSTVDAMWVELRRRFMPVSDWSGLEDALQTGWHSILHIYVYPFYMIEYAMAQLAAVQIWASASNDRAGAVRRYRRALALGATVPLPRLYSAAGARFAFDTATLRDAVSLAETTIEELEASWDC